MRRNTDIFIGLQNCALRNQILSLGKCKFKIKWCDDLKTLKSWSLETSLGHGASPTPCPRLADWLPWLWGSGEIGSGTKARLPSGGNLALLPKHSEFIHIHILNLRPLSPSHHCLCYFKAEKEGNVHVHTNQMLCPLTFNTHPQVCHWSSRSLDFMSVAIWAWGAGGGIGGQDSPLMGVVMGVVMGVPGKRSLISVGSPGWDPCSWAGGVCVGLLPASGRTGPGEGLP